MQGKTTRKSFSSSFRWTTCNRMRRKGELENVGEDKNTIINKTFCEQYSKFQQEYTLGIPILMNLQ
jgi:hypothetical protein